MHRITEQLSSDKGDISILFFSQVRFNQKNPVMYLFFKGLKKSDLANCLFFMGRREKGTTGQTIFAVICCIEQISLSWYARARFSSIDTK